MNNTEKLLRAFIEAQGYEVEATKDIKHMYRPGDVTDSGEPKENAAPIIITNSDYKVTRMGWSSKPSLHKIIREYEKEGMSASEMVGRIMLMEGITNEDL